MSPRRRIPDTWPWPADPPLVRRERVAQGYREALHKADPATALLLDARCARWGQSWILGTRRRLDDEELLTTDELADHLDVKPRTVDQWRYRDGLAAIDTADGIRYRWGTVVRFMRDRRHRRRAAARGAS